MLLIFFLFFQIIDNPVMSAPYTIAIGNKAYSSWSLRGWLAIRCAVGKHGFTERMCYLSGAGASQEKAAEARAEILILSPTGKVPCLFDEKLDVRCFHQFLLFSNA